jgi:hypothetical protein
MLRFGIQPCIRWPPILYRIRIIGQLNNSHLSFEAWGQFYSIDTARLKAADKKTQPSLLTNFCLSITIIVIKLEFLSINFRFYSSNLSQTELTRIAGSNSLDSPLVPFKNSPRPPKKHPQNLQIYNGNQQYPFGFPVDRG